MITNIYTLRALIKQHKNDFNELKSKKLTSRYPALSRFHLKRIKYYYRVLQIVINNS